MNNNKGFSLVELIIVIAIMAILVGVMAPQLIKYIEKTNVSSDTQLCDTVKTAITTAMMDPEILADSASVTKINGLGSGKQALSGLSGSTKFESAIKEALGVSAIGDVNGQLKSSGATAVSFQVVSSNSVHVMIDGTDATGKKTNSGSIIYVD